MVGFEGMKAVPGRVGFAAGILGLALAAAGVGQAAAGVAASDWQDGEKGDVRLIAATDGVGEDGTVRLGLEVNLEPGWKTYWRSPGDAGIPPSIIWDGSANIGSTEFLWPAPERFSYYGLDTFGYGDQIVYPIDVVAANVGESLQLRGQVFLLICDDVCIPHDYSVSLDLPAGPGGPSDHAGLLDRFRAQVPGDGSGVGLTLEASGLTGSAETPFVEVAFRSSEPFVAPDLLVEGPEDVVFRAPAIELSDDGLLARISVPAEDAFGDERALPLNAQPLMVTLVDGDRAMEAEIAPVFGGLAGEAGAPTVMGVSLLTIIGLALIGGLILNLMPCVLPVLSIKLLSVVSHGGGDPREVRLGFLATAAGIVTSFLALATGLLVLKSAGAAIGWGIQFQQPAFIIAMVLILTLFACNLWGMFEVRLPGPVSDAAVEHSGGTGLKGHFFSGAFATLLATPCSAPFLGTAVGFALSRGAFDIYSVFAALGLGMALPFLAVAVFPRVATKLPRPGTWMIKLKKILSLALAATAVWLITVLAAQVSIIAAVLVAVLMVVATLLIGGRGRLPAKAGSAVPAGVVLAAVLAFGVPVALPAAENTQKVEQRGDVAWLPFDEAAIPQLVAEGHTVFVDVTAEWCITCQVNKKRVLDVGQVAEALGNDRIITMKADWTRPSDVISEYLASFDRFGIPFNVVYGPDKPGGVVLPELLTDGAVLTALGDANTNFAIASN